MIFKANQHAKTILRLKATIPDKVEVYRATWENIAMPAILYAEMCFPLTCRQLLHFRTFSVA